MPEIPEIIDCPYEVDGARCLSAAEVLVRECLQSTDGSVEHIKTRCFEGHNLYFPVDMLPAEADYEIPNN